MGAAWVVVVIKFETYLILCYVIIILLQYCLICKRDHGVLGFWGFGVLGLGIRD